MSVCFTNYKCIWLNTIYFQVWVVGRTRTCGSFLQLHTTTSHRAKPVSAHSCRRQGQNRSKEWCPWGSHLSSDNLLQFDLLLIVLSLFSQQSCCCGQAGGAHLRNSDSISEIATELLLNLVFSAMGLCSSLRGWHSVLTLTLHLSQHCFLWAWGWSRLCLLECDFYFPWIKGSFTWIEDRLSVFYLHDWQWTRQSRVSPKRVAAEADEICRNPKPKQNLLPARATGTWGGWQTGSLECASSLQLLPRLTTWFWCSWRPGLCWSKTRLQSHWQNFLNWKAALLVVHPAFNGEASLFRSLFFRGEDEIYL